MSTEEDSFIGLPLSANWCGWGIITKVYYFPAVASK